MTLGELRKVCSRHQEVTITVLAFDRNTKEYISFYTAVDRADGGTMASIPEYLLGYEVRSIITDPNNYLRIDLKELI